MRHDVTVAGPMQEGRWVLTRDGLRIEERSVFAPGNVKATADNAKYREQVARWMGGRYTLRYSGSMAADVHHILNKGGGVFCNPASLTSPAKLRRAERRCHATRVC